MQVCRRMVIPVDIVVQRYDVRVMSVSRQSHVRVMSVLAGLWERMVIPVDVIVQRYDVRVMSECC